MNRKYNWEPIETLPDTMKNWQHRFIVLWDNGPMALVPWNYEITRWHDIQDYVALPNRCKGWWCPLDVLPDVPDNER